MDQPRKLTSKHQAQEESVSSQQQEQAKGREFASPEEMLRHDALQTVVPPGIASRLHASIQQTTPEKLSWWQRLFGSSKP
jgi:hypothetical protein